MWLHGRLRGCFCNDDKHRVITSNNNTHLFLEFSRHYLYNLLGDYMRLRKKHFAIPEMKENPYVFFETEGLKDRWQEIFGNNNEIRVELGAGKGEFLRQMALRHPDVNFVAFDKETNAFIYAARKIKDNELNNVRAVAIDIEKIDEVFNEDAVSTIYINFCNPWPKPRQQKRRLTYPLFLERYKKFLKVGGKIYLKVDDRDLFEASLDYFDECGFKCVFKTFDMKLEDFPDNIVTEYESKWRSIDKPILYGIFERIN